MSIDPRLEQLIRFFEQIDPSNVGKLALAWSFELGPGGGNQQATNAANIAQAQTNAALIGNPPLDRIERWYRRATSAPTGRGGAVTVLQRFGSSLALNLHYHALHLDGVYVEDEDGNLTFRAAVPHQEDVETLVVEIGFLAERWLTEQGFPKDDDTADPGTARRWSRPANSKLRSRVVPRPRPPTRAQRWRLRSRKLARKPRGLRLGWADLLERVFGYDVFVCKRCGGRLHFRAVVVNPPATTKILMSLARARPPPAVLAG